MNDRERWLIVEREWPQDKPLGLKDGDHSNGNPGASANDGSRPGRAESA